MKTYYTQNNIGRAKYCVFFHNGIKQHKDGSPFYDIEIFRNKVKLAEYISTLQKDGYREQ